MADNSDAPESVERVLRDALGLLMSPSGPDEKVAEFANALSERFEVFKLVEASASGYRQYLTERGWDEDITERIAADQLIHILHDIF